jgi:hypothetical protein
MINFKITDKLINPSFNKECIFCFEDVNNEYVNNESESESVNNESESESVNNKDVNNESVKLNINTSKIILECNHNYHFMCFFRYIISKLKINDESIFLKYKRFKCPLCQSSLECSTLDNLLRTHAFLLNEDIKTIKNDINKKVLKIKYKKFVFFIKNILNKEIYLQELYNYYKYKENVKKLIKKQEEILTMIYILKNITLY